MATRNVLVTVFLVLIAGGALAWYFARGDADEGARGGGVATAGPRGAEEHARPDADLVGGDVVDGGAAAKAADRREVAVDPLRGAAASSADAVAAPTPAISGRVVDPYGRPVEGATVLAASNDGFPLDYAADGPVPPYVRRSVATTDAEGRYALDGLAPPSFRLLVRAAGYAPHAESRLPLPDAAEHELDDVVLDPGAILEGLVVDPFGQPVAGAELFVEETSGFRFSRFFGGVGPRPNAVADAGGRFRLDELALGAWRVRVESEEHPDRTFEGLAERAGQVLTRTFELEVGDLVAGRVTEVPAAERGDLLVRATPAQGGDFFGFAGAGSREGRVDATGEFVVKGLRPDTDYDLQVRMRTSGTGFRGFNARTRSERVPARAGQRGVEIPYRPEAAVLFQVVDAQTDEPVEEFHVESGFRWREPLRGDDMRPIELHPEGRARIGNLRPDRSPAELGVEITAVGYEPWEREDVPVVSAQETDLGVIRLEPLPMVRVTVLDAATGAPVPGAQVSLEEQREERGGPGRGFRERRVTISIDDSTGEPLPVGEPGRSAVTDEDGLALLNSLEGRTAVLRVRREGYAPAVVADLELPVGDAIEQVVELGRGGAVVARVVDGSGAPVAGVRVDHRAPDDDGAFPLPFVPGRRGGDPVTNREGEVRFESLAPGEHRFRIERPGRGGRAFGGSFFVALDGGEEEEPGWETVAVAEGSEDVVTLVQPDLGRLTGRITEVGVELAGASLRLSPAGPDRGGFDVGRILGGGEAERTDSSGRYALEDVEPGEYVLAVSHPKRRMPMEFEVEIAAGDNRFDAELPLSILEGRVTDEDGKPLSGVEVTARKAEGGGRGPGGRMVFRSIGGPGGGGGGTFTFGDDALGAAARTDADGYFALRGVTPDVELVVRATGEGVQPGESAPVQVPVNEVRKGVDLTLEAAGAVRVEAFQADGSPAEFVMVRASYQDQVPEGSTSDGADPKAEFMQSGPVRLTGMRPGRWSVSVGSVGPGGGGDGPEPQEVVVEVGVEPTLTFHMP